MDRREFLKLTATGAATFGLGLWPHPTKAAAPAVDLVVAHGSSPWSTVKAAINGLGGINNFISRGDVVVVKPNIGWDRTPEFAATTNPDVVACVIKLCLNAGAKTVKVFDRSVNDPRRCYVQSGIADAARNAGAEVSFTDERKFRDVAIPGGQSIKRWPVYTELLESDKIINLPIAKHHGLSRLTLSMKNWLGVLGSSRNMLHQDLDRILCDLAQVIKPSVTIMDATRILTRNGPQGGSVSDVKKLDTVVAGRNQVAVDAFATTFFDLTPMDLGVLRNANKAGLGPVDTTKMNIQRVSA